MGCSRNCTRIHNGPQLRDSQFSALMTTVNLNWIFFLIIPEARFFHGHHIKELCRALVSHSKLNASKAPMTYLPVSGVKSKELSTVPPLEGEGWVLCVALAQQTKMWNNVCQDFADLFSYLSSFVKEWVGNGEWKQDC